MCVVHAVALLLKGVRLGRHFLGGDAIHKKLFEGFPIANDFL